MTIRATDTTGTAGRAVNGTYGAGSPLGPQTVRALEAAGLEVSDVVRVVRAALDEDFRYGADVTSAATVAGRTVTANVVAREAGVIAGLPVALAVLDLIAAYLGGGGGEAGAPDNAAPPTASEAVVETTRDTSGPHEGTLHPTGPRQGGGPGAGTGGPALAPDGLGMTGAALAPAGLGVTGVALAADGARVMPGDAVLRVSGDAVAVLGAERTMLNFLTHLSGIASVTWAWASAVAGTGAVVRDTRKTLPGLRSLEKYAVRRGGGENYRMGLGDAALVKDNHIAAAGGVTAAVHAVHAAARPGLAIEVECDSVAQVREALSAGARFLLLDNMPFPALREAVAVARAYAGVRLEASGGLQLANAREVASLGVDYLAVGGLTHSAQALDLGLDYFDAA